VVSFTKKKKKTETEPSGKAERESVSNIQLFTPFRVPKIIAK
jgi:hypothetical protein